MPGLRGLIELKRLEYVPWTEYCVASQDKLERGEPSGVDMSGNDVPLPSSVLEQELQYGEQVGGEIARLASACSHRQHCRADNALQDSASHT